MHSTHSMEGKEEGAAEKGVMQDAGGTHACLGDGRHSINTCPLDCIAYTIQDYHGSMHLHIQGAECCAASQHMRGRQAPQIVVAAGGGGIRKQGTRDWRAGDHQLDGNSWSGVRGRLLSTLILADASPHHSSAQPWPHLSPMCTMLGRVKARSADVNLCMCGYVRLSTWLSILNPHCLYPRTIWAGMHVCLQQLRWLQLVV